LNELLTHKPYQFIWIHLFYRIINWTQVGMSYMPHVFLSGLGLLIALIFHQVMTDIFKSQPPISITSTPYPYFSLEIWLAALSSIQELLLRQKNVLFSLVKATETIFSPAVETTFVALVIMAWILKKDNPVYLLSFATFKPPQAWRVSHDQIIEMMKRQECYTEESLDFMRRLLERSGTGQSTAWPPGIVQCLHGQKTDRSVEASRQEAKTVIFSIVEQALREAQITPKDIDVLVINCSLFSPTPSLCAMVINHFQFRPDILSYNLSGMGCGASLLALDLAKNTLQARFRNTIWGGKALVISTEIITPNLYHGNERGFLLQNTLFRCGGAAIVLSNNWMDGSKAWFKLLHLVRVQGTSDESYHCVYESEDSEGHRGVSLSKDIVLVAGKTMEKNLGTLGPYILPLSEQIHVAYSIAARVILKTMGKWMRSKNLPMVKMYVPDFKRGIDHFCIHAGGRAVIDGM